MAKLTDSRKPVLLVCETKNNGAPTVIGTHLDTLGWKSVCFLLGLGANAAAVTMKIQESADAASWADIAGAVIAALDSDDDNKVVALEVALVSPRLRYLKPVITISDAAPGAALSLWALLGDLSTAAADFAPKDLAQRVSV